MRVYKTILASIILLLLVINAMAQHQELYEKPQIYKGKTKHAKDTTSLIHAFKNGLAHGHFRGYSSFTLNDGHLTDYYANALGGGLRYETAYYHNFQFVVSGFYIFNVGSSDFTKPDASTGQLNRYEIGLFDLENPDNKKDLDRLEELQLNYKYKNLHVTYGRQLINTPFINLQDGRMRPTSVEGLWLEKNGDKKWDFKGGYLFAVSPRSTTKWYTIGESIGLYPVGVDSSGKKSAYAGNTHSSGVALGNVSYSPTKSIRLNLWNIWIDNISNTSLLQFDVQKKNEKHTNYAGIQFYYQQSVGNGGNENPEKTYQYPNSKAIVVSSKIGRSFKKWDFNVNYTRITQHGRYLMPREWGRDAFFTFMPRERNEGFGDVHAVVVRAEKAFPKYRIKTQLAGGYFMMPDVLNFNLNKYGMPSYYQINFDFRYQFNGFWNGLDLQLLAVSKLNAGELHNNLRYKINKVDMLHINLVLNYHF